MNQHIFQPYFSAIFADMWVTTHIECGKGVTVSTACTYMHTRAERGRKRRNVVRPMLLFLCTGENIVCHIWNLCDRCVYRELPVGAVRVRSRELSKQSASTRMTL